MHGQTLFLNLRLTPHRSLDARQFRWLIAGTSLVCLLAGLRFLALGAWPVMAFMVLDVLILYWAFRANYRAAERFEDIRLDETAFTVHEVLHTGAERTTSFQAGWLKVHLEQLNEDENRLLVRSHGRSMTLGSFLSPAERVEVGQEIEAGLARRLDALRGG